MVLPKTSRVDREEGGAGGGGSDAERGEELSRSDKNIVRAPTRQEDGGGVPLDVERDNLP